MFDLTTGAVLFCVVAGLFFLCLWLYYDRRDHRLFEGERRKITFHCLRCDALYAARAGTQSCACPKCGHMNNRLKF
jgi:hypothetical protein